MSVVRRLPGESWFAVFGRRALSIPLYATLTVCLFGLLPILLPLALLADLASRERRRLAKARTLLFFCVYLGCEMLGVIAAGVLWLVFAGGRWRGAANYLEQNAALQRLWTDALFFSAVRIFSMRLAVQGVNLCATGPFLLFVRHASTADTVLAAALLANRHRLLLLYVLKRELLWDPCIDIIGRRLPNAFMERSGDKGDIAAVKELARGLAGQRAVLIFPEGTRFSPQKLRKRLDELQSRSPALHEIAKSYTNVLAPKLGGPLALMETAPPTDIVFLEHTGFEGASSFRQLFAGALVGRTIYARFRRIAAADIPSQARDEWLFRKWQECDRFIADKQVLADDQGPGASA